jgi:hypothetical protein
VLQSDHAAVDLSLSRSSSIAAILPLHRTICTPQHWPPRWLPTPLELRATPRHRSPRQRASIHPMQQVDVALKAHVARVCFKCFKGILQVFQMDVKKVDRNVAYVAIVVHVCCKRLFIMFHLFFLMYLSGCCICFTHMLPVFYLLMLRMFGSF